MQPELIIFLLMVGSFMLSCFAFKLSAGIGMVIAAIVGALAGGMGFPVKQFVEGTFAFLDTILVIAAAMIFMKCIQNSGALDVINRIIIRRFARYPALLLICLMFVIMFPGMITGSSTAAVISAGVIVAPILMMLGVPKDKAGAILALGGMFGATAPPVNMAVMAIGGGIDMPYTGFDLPLVLLSFPLAIFSVLFLGYKHVKKVDVKKVAAEYQNEEAQKPSLLLFMPLIVMVLLMVLPEIFPSVFPSLGMTLIFLICAVLAMFTGKKMNPLRTVYDAVNSALPVMGILMGVGMFIQIMTATGVKGYIVISSVSLPTVLLYVAIALLIPLFGSISSMGAATVLGVPFVLSLISSDQTIVASAIASIASVGELMPPTALAGMFAANVVGEEKYIRVVKQCIIPALGIIIVSMLFIIFANPIASVIG